MPRDWTLPTRCTWPCIGDSTILSLAVLSTALLFGGMTLYSFGFAAFLFTALPAKTAAEALRRAFPWFYLFVIATAAVAILCFRGGGVRGTELGPALPLLGRC